MENKIINITVDQIPAVIARTGGLIFSVVFTKLNGDLRKMNARLGVRKDQTGRGLNYNPTDKRMTNVWSMRDGGYRNVKWANVSQIVANHVTYKVQRTRNLSDVAVKLYQTTASATLQHKLNQIIIDCEWTAPESQNWSQLQMVLFNHYGSPRKGTESGLVADIMQHWCKPTK